MGIPLNDETVIAGVIMIVVGIFFGWLFCLGGVLVLVGIVLLIVGLVEDEKTGVNVRPRYPMGPPGSSNFCPHCGQQVPAGAVSCSGCGRGLA